MQIIAENISYTFLSGKNALHDISLSLPKGEKAALAGDNGSGKSTFLRILSGEIPPDSGSVQIAGRHWIIPQHFGQYDSCTIAQVLQVQEKTDALHEIENGSVDPGHFETIAGDCSIYGRLQSALEKWKLTSLSHNSPFKSLSGGEKTRVFLSGINLHYPDLVLMDEPTNHLDQAGREMLCRMVKESVNDFLIVSHDRELLNLCNPVYELSPLGIKRYGGNYNFYEEQKQIELDALDQRMSHTRQTISF